MVVCKHATDNSTVCEHATHSFTVCEHAVRIFWTKLWNGAIQLILDDALDRPFRAWLRWSNGFRGIWKNSCRTGCISGLLYLLPHSPESGQSISKPLPVALHHRDLQLRFQGPSDARRFILNEGSFFEVCNLQAKLYLHRVIEELTE